MTPERLRKARIQWAFITFASVGLAVAGIAIGQYIWLLALLTPTFAFFMTSPPDRRQFLGLDKKR